MNGIRRTIVRGTENGHRLNIVFRPDIAMSVYAEIGECWGITPAARGWLSFIVWVFSPEDAGAFMDEWDWALESICDLDQEDGGSYI